MRFAKPIRVKVPKFHAGVRKTFRLAKTPPVKVPNTATAALRRMTRNAMPSAHRTFK